jgi:tetrahydromethanopterin S-methyltransferase subunit B
MKQEQLPELDQLVEDIYVSLSPELDKSLEQLALF